MAEINVALWVRVAVPDEYNPAAGWDAVGDGLEKAVADLVTFDAHDPAATRCAINVVMATVDPGQ